MNVSEELGRLYRERNKLTAAMIVEAAEPEDSPLHSRFEWDDSKAGHQYRLIQARILIRSTRVEIEGTTQRLIHVPVDITRGTREGEYVVPSELTLDEHRYQRALKSALCDLDSAIERVGELQTLGKVDKADKERYGSALDGLKKARSLLVATN